MIKAHFGKVVQKVATYGTGTGISVGANIAVKETTKSIGKVLASTAASNVAGFGWNAS